MSLLYEHLTNWFHKEVPLIPNPTPLLVLAIILITGFIFIRIARKIKLPVVTGQIIGGIFIGHYVLNLFHEEAYTSFVPITNFALGFIGLTIGSHLNFRKLHNAGKRIFLIVFSDAIITPLVVFFSLKYLANLPIEICLIVSAISITTAPGSTIHVVKEKRAKGIFTKTLLAVVALNNVITILIFYTIYYYLFAKGAHTEVSVIQTLSKPILLLLESVIIGSIVGYAVIYFTEKHKTSVSFLTIVILAVVITVGASETLHFSGILSCLILGIIITNYSKHKSGLFNAFHDVEKEVFTMFFVLAGTHLDFKNIYAAGLAGLVLIGSRLVGKTLAPTIGAYLAGATKTIKHWIGFSLYPIAGLAIGLVFLVENIPYFHSISSEITAIVLTAVVVYELLGPIATGFSIQKAGEQDKNRMRLMDFLQEEYITIDLEAKDKWQALDELAEFLFRTHKITEISLETLKKTIFDREKDISTGIGDSLAIPHAIIEGGPKIRGVIAISKKGINFDALDDRPVHIIILIATPKENYDLHLHVLANIAKIFGHHPHIKERMINARTPEQVFEILQAEEVDELNPFFEE